MELPHSGVLIYLSSKWRNKLLWYHETGSVYFSPLKAEWIPDFVNVDVYLNLGVLNEKQEDNFDQSLHSDLESCDYAQKLPPSSLSHTRGDALSYRKRTPTLRYSATRETTKQYHNVGTSHSCEGSSEHNHKHPNSTLTCLFCSYCIIYWIHMGSGIQKRLHI